MAKLKDFLIRFQKAFVIKMLKTFIFFDILSPLCLNKPTTNSPETHYNATRMPLQSHKNTTGNYEFRKIKEKYGRQENFNHRILIYIKSLKL